MHKNQAQTVAVEDIVRYPSSRWNSEGFEPTNCLMWASRRMYWTTSCSFLSQERTAALMTSSIFRPLESLESRMTRGSPTRTLRASWLTYLTATMAGVLPRTLLVLTSTFLDFKRSATASGMLNRAAVWRAVCPWLFLRFTSISGLLKRYCQTLGWLYLIALLNPCPLLQLMLTLC